MSRVGREDMERVLLELAVACHVAEVAEDTGRNVDEADDNHRTALARVEALALRLYDERRALINKRAADLAERGAYEAAKALAEELAE
jgi:hypothetical protein